MQITTVRIPYETGQSFMLKPLFDAHLGNRACDTNALRKYVQDGDESTYYMIGGDLYDGVIVGDKRYQKSIDSTEGTEIVDEQVDKGVALLEAVKDRIIGIGMGNHEYTILQRCATNMSKRLADALGVPYIGYSGLIRVVFYQEYDDGKTGRGRTCMIRWHHGWGGGTRTQGGSITKYSKDTAYWDADLFLYGHDHRLQTDDVPRMTASGNKLVANPKRICLCGSFLRTYIDGDVTYSERAGYPPISIGGLSVRMTPDANSGTVKLSPLLGG